MDPQADALAALLARPRHAGPQEAVPKAPPRASGTCGNRRGLAAPPPPFTAKIEPGRWVPSQAIQPRSRSGSCSRKNTARISAPRPRSSRRTSRRGREARRAAGRASPRRRAPDRFRPRRRPRRGDVVSRPAAAMASSNRARSPGPRWGSAPPTASRDRSSRGASAARPACVGRSSARRASRGAARRSILARSTGRRRRRLDCPSSIARSRALGGASAQTTSRGTRISVRPSPLPRWERPRRPSRPVAKRLSTRTGR